MRYLLAALLTLGLLTACGHKGPVRLPEPKTPAAVADATVRQQGERAVLAMTLPTVNQDGSPLTDLAAVIVQRAPFDPANDCPDCPRAWQLVVRAELDSLQQARRIGDRLYAWDPNLRPDEGYRYRLVPVNRRDRAGVATELTLVTTVPPPAPSQPRAEGRDRHVELQWEPVADVAGYQVYRRTGGGIFPPWPLNREPLPAPHYVDTDVRNGQDYIYAVRSLAPAGAGTVESELSPTVSATPLPPR